MFRRLSFTLTVLGIFALVGTSTALARHGCYSYGGGYHYGYRPAVSYYHGYYPSPYGYYGARVGHYGPHGYYRHHGYRGYRGHGGVHFSVGF